MDRRNEKFTNHNIETPAVLKSCRRTSRSPNPTSRSHFLPSKSGLLQQIFHVPPKENYSESMNSVIVFGYTDSMKELVLEKFRKIGEVVNFSYGSGNWFTISYSESTSVSKALAFNGQYLSEKVIIGVKMSLSSQEPPKERPVYLDSQNYHNSQYLKTVPRRKADFLEKFTTYVLNMDSCLVS